LQFPAIVPAFSTVQRLQMVFPISFCAASPGPAVGRSATIRTRCFREKRGLEGMLAPAGFNQSNRSALMKAGRKMQPFVYTKAERPQVTM
jgi:hypothetical protein